MGKYSFDWSAVTQNLQQEEANKKKGFQADPRFFKLQPDEKGNATAIIRFLPDSTMTPFVKYYTHNFKYVLDGTTKYWIRNCLNTFGYEKECPICKKNQEYWNSAFESDKVIASQRKRKLVFTANILVIKNPNNPDLEGKVMLYSFGQKIYDKLKDKMFPSDEVKALGEGMYEEYIPFDLENGANFKLVQVKQGEFPNYDKSEFGKQAPLGTEAKIDSVMKQVYDLSEFMADDKFPTNDEIVTKLGKLLGLSKSDTTTSTALTETDTLEDISTNLLDDQDIPDFTPPSDPDSTSTDDEDDADFFLNLK